MMGADDFADDWYGHVTNQAGHAYVIGTGLALLGATILPPLWVPPVMAALYFLIWEVAIQRGKLWADSIEDTAFVMAGASPICGALWYASDFMAAWLTVAICYVSAMIVLAIGALRRWQP